LLFHRSSGLGTSAWAIIIMALVIAAGVTYYALSPTGGTGTGPTTGGAVQTVQIRMPQGVAEDQSLNFQPSAVTVVVGVNNTIQWKNFDSVSHTVASTSVPSGAQAFGSTSNLVGPGQEFTITLTVPGTYHYHCTIHPSHMVGTIIVKEG
jgi:plastocyanin